MTGRGGGGGRDFFLTEIFHDHPVNFFKKKPQLKITEIFHTPVSLVVEGIVPKARHTMTIGTAGALGALTAFQLVQSRALLKTRGQSPRKTLETLHFMMSKIAQKATLAFSCS